MTTHPTPGKSLCVGALVLTLAPLLSLTVGCRTTATPRLYPPSPDEPTQTVYLTANGWHSGIVLPADRLPAPLDEAFENTELPAGTRWIEFGWGDDAFYKAEEETSGMTVAAMLLPTRSTVHLWCLDREPPRFFRAYAANVYRLTLGDRGYAALGDKLAEYIAVDEAGRAVYQREGLYGPTSGFFTGRRRYHLLHNCNQMSADVLVAGGLPLSPGLAFHASNIERQLRKRVADAEPGLLAWEWETGHAAPE